MSGKQMEGDNQQRRRRGRDARSEGEAPSEAQVTLGASKAPEHVPHSADHEEHVTAPLRGKQRASQVERKRGVSP